MMKLKFADIPLCLLLFTVILPSCMDSNERITITDWKVLYGGDQSLKNIVKSQKWEKIRIPSAFKVSAGSKNEFHFLWLKGVFNIKESPSDYKGISTGRIRLSDEIYINHHFIGSLPSEKVNWNPVPRNYPIPPGTLHTSST